MIENIHIYHTNDVHSHLENWPKIKHFLTTQKEEHTSCGEEVFLFDIGDHVDRWHPYTEATIGKGNIRLLNDVGYTAVTIGNNEGITLAHENLDVLYGNAHFDVIVANLYKQNQCRPKWALPFQVYETKSGVRIGVVAVTAYFEKLYQILGWHLAEPIAELKNQIVELQSKADVIILLSHLGIHEDEKIAMMFPEIDVILGGHTHHILPEGKRIITNADSTETLLGAAGKHGNFVGYVQLQIDTKNCRILKNKATLFETKRLPSPPYEKETISFYQNEGKRLLSQAIVSIPHDLSVEWFKESPLTKLLCEAIYEWCDADCSFINAGLVLENLAMGMITKYDIHKMLPHPINPCVIELNGRDLETVIFQTFDPKWPTLELKGLGFRGKVFGNFIYHQISFDPLKQQIFIQGRPIDKNKTYKLGTIDMYTFGHFSSELLKAKKKYLMPEFLRDVMEWKLKHEYLK